MKRGKIHSPRDIPQHGEKRKINLDIKQRAARANKNMGGRVPGIPSRQTIYQVAPAAISFSLHAASEFSGRNKYGIEILLRAMRSRTVRPASRSRIDQAQSETESVLAYRRYEFPCRCAINFRGEAGISNCRSR